MILYRYVRGAFTEADNRPFLGQQPDLPLCKPMLSTHAVEKETPKGYWIADEMGRRKFVLKGRGKRYAHETLEWALESFIRRREHYIIWLRHELRASEVVLGTAKDWAANGIPEEVNVYVFG
jgi:hypothetical protein